MSSKKRWIWLSVLFVFLATFGLTQNRVRNDLYARAYGYWLTQTNVEIAGSVAKAAAAGYGIIWITPIDGTTDDEPRLHAIEQSNMYHNAVGLLPGPGKTHWKIKSAGNTPSGTWIIGTSGTIMDATGVGGGVGNGVFSMLGVGGGTNIAISAPSTLGSNQISAASSITPGTYVLITKHNTGDLLGSIYQVLSVSGGGPFTWTLDEGIVYSFTTSDLIKPLNTSVDYPTGPATDIKIYGNGLTINNAITGSTITIEQIRAQNITLDDITINTTGTQTNGITFDTGSRNCITRNVRINGDFSLGSQGIWVQGNRHVVENSSVFNMNSSIGISMISCANCTLKANKVFNSGFGYTIGSDGLPTTYDGVGLNNTMVGNFSYGCGTGVSVTSSVRNQIIGHQSIGDSVSYDIQGTSAAPAPVPIGTMMTSLSAISPSNTGLLIETGVIALTVDGLDVSNNVGNGGISWNGEAKLSNIIDRNNNSLSTFVTMPSSGSGTLTNFDVDTIGGTIFTIAGSLRASGGIISFNIANAEPININSGGKLFLERTVLGGTNPASAIALHVNNGGKLFYESQNDFSTCPFPIQIEAGGYSAVTQDQGLKTVNTTGGITNLTLLDSQSSTIKTTGTLGSNATIIILGQIPAAGGNASGLAEGETFTVTNANTGGFTTTFEGPSGTGFAVAQTKSATGFINATGDLIRSGPDTWMSPALMRQIYKHNHPANDNVNTELRAA